MSESDVLAPFVKSIALAHDELGHEHGCRFLYTPARTLGPDTRMAFISANPGYDRFVEPIWSVEKGNAFRDDMEPWWPERQKRGLRRQVQLFFAMLAKALGAPADQLMDETLTFNFCPFRSPDWASLPNAAESLRFSQRTCERVLDIVEPPAIVCNGTNVAVELDRILRVRGRVIEGPVSRPIAWGQYKYSVARYTTKHGPEVTMVGFPHLSRFGIFSRPESKLATTEIVDTISAALRNASPTT
jgi:hypothetical protein